MQEIVCVSFGHEFPFVVLLYEILVTLLLSKADGVIFALEIKMRALEEIC